MDDQKLDDLLNLSLDATQEEREKSLVLEEGYDPATRQWELIVKYSGDIEVFAPYAERVTPLLNEYAIVWIREENIEAFSNLLQVEFIEQPKRLFFSAAQGKRASCIPPVQSAPYFLTGAGVLVAVIDSGADIFNRSFRNADGSTRIAALWDQTVPEGEERREDEGRTAARRQTAGEWTAYISSLIGRVYTQEELDRILGAAAADEAESTGSPFTDAFSESVARRDVGFLPGEDRSGHGTAVLGIAAGYDRVGTGGVPYQGVAYESPLIVVKLAAPDPLGFPRTTQLMLGIDFAVRTALAMQMPVAVNLSFGNSYGPHDGTSLLAQYIDDLANYWKSVIVIGAGNEGAQAGHVRLTGQSGRTRQNAVGRNAVEQPPQTGYGRTFGFYEEEALRVGQETTVRLGVGEFEPGLNVQIWKQYADIIEIAVISPGGVRYELPMSISGAHRVRLGTTELLIFVGEPGPYSIDQEIFIDFLPVETYVDAGEWRFVFTPLREVTGAVNLWLPGGGVLSAQTRFLNPNPALTLTVPSTARRAITVAAYDSRQDTFADFSGRGGENLTKPDLAAPGVEITAPIPGGGYGSFSGTSMAAPFVTGSAALLMQWGIVNGNDPYLYGEKVKAYLQRGARPLPFIQEYPNALIGYGALCVADSLPI